MTGVSDTPIWVVASYFLAWPWRRSAMAPAEQKVYLAQVAANGADPMVNLSGGPPAVHEDPRGFDAICDLYGFLATHQAYYEGMPRAPMLPSCIRWRRSSSTVRTIPTGVT